jgi:hypothetical protein
MISCNYIRSLIDEAEQVNSLPLEVNVHLDGCQDCRAFADERMRLRALLGSLPSITVPANFNGQLKARLEASKSKPDFTWLSSAGYLRFGTATAVLVVAAFALQYSGFFNPTTPGPNANIAAFEDSTKSPLPSATIPPVTMPSNNEKSGSTEVIDPASGRQSNLRFTPVAASRRGVRVSPSRVPAATPEDLDIADYSERTVRPFSVGAQDRIYMRSDSATPVRTVSF